MAGQAHLWSLGGELCIVSQFIPSLPKIPLKISLLQQATRGYLGIGEGAVGGQFQKLSLTFSNAW